MNYFSLKLLRMAEAQARAKGAPPEYPSMEKVLISSESASFTTSPGQSNSDLPGFESESE